jgi:HPt (histidine-containing phosphotransfer) domain-containing protein
MIAVDDSAPMDYQYALEEFEGDREFLQEILQGFLNSAENHIATIHRYISEQNAEGVRKEAHSIKGGAANLCADRLSKIAEELENNGASGKIGKDSVDILGKLEKEFNRLQIFAGNQ